MADLTITRIFDAPREAVWKAWTDPKQVSQWWGPRGFTAPVVELDVRPGGDLRIDMQGPDGTVYANRGVFHEVSEPERLVVTTRLLNDDGEPVIDGLSTVTFADDDGKTRLTLEFELVHVAPEAAEAAAGAEEGWNESFDRLAEYLEAA
jgi:uncharacterized protein YndB with AHSA1/START domain